MKKEAIDDGKAEGKRQKAKGKKKNQSRSFNRRGHGGGIESFTQGR